MEENGQQPGCDRLSCPPYVGRCGPSNIGLSGIAMLRMALIPRQAASAVCTAVRNAAIYFHRIKCRQTTSNLLSHWRDLITRCGWNTIGMNYYKDSIVRLMDCRRSASPAIKRRVWRKGNREMNTKNRTQYDKATATMGKKNSLVYMVKRKPSLYWANLLQKHVADSRIRGWAASIIWWAYPNSQSPDRNSLLYGMMELFRPSVFGRDEELNSVFKKLGLPKPVHETFQPTHPSNRQPKILGHL
jgi:hypothetical protein